MTDEEFLDACKYAIIAVQDNNVLHFCSYMEPPSEEEIMKLDEELQTDPEFNLIGVEYDLLPCPPDIFEEIMNQIRKQRK